MWTCVSTRQLPFGDYTGVSPPLQFVSSMSSSGVLESNSDHTTADVRAYAGMLDAEDDVAGDVESDVEVDGDDYARGHMCCKCFRCW